MVPAEKTIDLPWPSAPNDPDPDDMICAFGVLFLGVHCAGGEIFFGRHL